MNKPDYITELRRQFPEGSAICMPHEVLAARLDNAYMKGNDDGLVYTRTDLQATIDQLRGELAAARVEARRANERWEEARNVSGGRIAQAADALEAAAALKELSKENEALETKLELAVERITELEAECASWCKESDRLKQDRDDARSLLTEERKDNNEMARKLLETNEKLTKAERRAVELRSALGGALDRAKSDLPNVIAVLTALKARCENP